MTAPSGAIIGRGAARAVLALALLALSGLPAAADYPYCRCTDRAGTITCDGGFSDGSSAEGVTLDVIGYDGTPLASRRFGAEGRVQFPKPAGAFYILFDAGPGQVVELDWRDLRAPGG